MSESVRATLLFISCAFSVLLFGVGIVGPLTPSRGFPRAAEVAAFYVVPLLTCASMYFVATKRSETVFVTATFAVIAASGAWVLSITYGILR